ncbi:LAME_0E00892g1_1 [Lachancea meyersii CBS 8951]|uniref:Guanine nucleotide-binding protein alpha-1 subunit n=1 Tax=Lachancea meyersii CBS 8951 TaxID=1266667 RepID=A0A1G4JF17_9SACH|nr:LAME_0E00892g1_1 [Lachancea meyersii CBS 8951]
MGCGASAMAPEDEKDLFLQSKKANEAIERSLQMQKQKENKEIKLLLLGAGESGKSTVLKQLRLLHQGGFSNQERIQYTQVIWADAIQSMKILIIQARRLGIPLDCDNPQTNRHLFEQKRLLLKAKPLELIDAGLAGGSGFLNDYVLKYSETSEKKRRGQSTGRAQAFRYSAGLEHQQGQGQRQGQAQQMDLVLDLDLQELSQGLNEGEANPAFARQQQQQHQQQQPASTAAQVAEAIQTLWRQDRGIRQCFARSNEFQLESSAEYYFEHIDQFATPGYVCSDEDILKGRIKTTGITETTFSVGSSSLKVLDAGGQRSERRKWIHCFQGITAVLFVLAVSEYDQMLFEDERVNRMHESIMLFDTLLSSKWFADTPFILFLNKTDLFRAKLTRSPIRQFFPHYQGRVNDAEAGLRYFENVFLSLNKTQRPIYVHRTCATDPQSMRFVLTAVADLVVQQNLKKSGLL